MRIIKNVDDLKKEIKENELESLLSISLDSSILKQILYNLFLIDFSELEDSKIIILESGESADLIPEIEGKFPEEVIGIDDEFTQTVYILDDYGNGIIVMERIKEE